MEKIIEVVKLKQVTVDTDMEVKSIQSPKVAAEIASQFIGDDDREVFLVMCLNTKNQVIAAHRCHVGSLNASIVHPREVFKTAIINNACSIIVAHQHPSGDVTPSREDIDITERLIEAGNIIGIELLDHLIVNDKCDYTSLREKGIWCRN